MSLTRVVQSNLAQARNLNLVVASKAPRCIQDQVVASKAPRCIHQDQVAASRALLSSLSRVVANRAHPWSAKAPLTQAVFPLYRSPVKMFPQQHQ